MSSKVTKQKNTGRVAAGKRLAEWNRKNKFELSQEPSELSQEPSQEPSQEHSQEQASMIKSEYLYGVGFLIVVGLVIYAVKPAAATKTSLQEPVKDPRGEEKQTHSVLKKRDPFLI